VFGGKSTEDEPLNELMILGAEKLVWTRPRVVGDPPSPRQAHSATIVRDSIFFHGIFFFFWFFFFFFFLIFNIFDFSFCFVLLLTW
jgi:hypothetical protein